MNHKFSTCFCFILFLLAGISCSKKSVPPPVGMSPSAPSSSPGPLPTNFPAMSSINSISEIRLPVLIDSDALVRQVNLLIPTILYEDNDITDDKMIIRAEKMDSVQLSILPNKLMYNVPFRLHIERDIGISRVKAEGAMRIFFNTDYSILEDWRFETTTTIISHEWIETPKVKLGIINIPIELIADKIMSRSANIVCKNIDAQLQDGFRLRDYVDLAWRKIQQPIQISDTPHVSWLLIQPEKIKMVPINTVDGTVQTSLEFRSITDIEFGPKPELPYAGVLPTFEQIDKLAKDSLIELTVRFPLQRGEQLLRDYFKDQEFRDGNKVMIIDSLHITGRSPKVHVEAFVSGTYPATLELEGVPVYNKIRRRFELKDMDYSLKSKNILVKAASWILKKNLNKKLEELMVYDVGSYIDSGKKNLKEALSQIKTLGFSMKADIKDVWALDPVLMDDQAEVKFLADGQFRILIDELVK